MRKFLLALTLTVVAAFGVGISGGSALAASCTTRASSDGYPPQLRMPQLGGYVDPFQLDCNGTSVIQWQDRLFRGGYAGYWQSAVYTYSLGTSGPVVATTSYTANSCGSFGVPYWWGHYLHFRIFNDAQQSWGSWTDSLQSAGVYGICYG